MKVTQYNSIQYSYTVLTFFQTIVDSLDSPTRTLKLNYSKKNPCMGVLTFYNPFSPDEHFNISVKWHGKKTKDDWKQWVGEESDGILKNVLELKHKMDWFSSSFHKVLGEAGFHPKS